MLADHTHVAGVAVGLCLHPHSHLCSRLPLRSLTMANRCNPRVIGSGTFDCDGRVLALENSRPKVAAPLPVAKGYEPPIQSDIVCFETKMGEIQPYDQDDCRCLSASAVQKCLVETLNELPTFCARNEDVDLPQLTKASIASNDSSPVSSVCSTGSRNPSDPDTGGLCRTGSQDDELSTSNSYCSTDDAPLTSTPCERSPPDIYGQRHPIESPALITQKLQEFENELLKTGSVHTASKKGGTPDPNFLLAERNCPDIVTPSFKLMFLRCECYDVANSLKRYVRYWDKRVELFGPSRAFQPFTVESLYVHNDQRALEIGSMQIIEREKSYDTSLSSIYPPVDTSAPDERNILWFDTSKLEPTQYTREAGCRVLWYIFHAYLEDVQVQQRGLICINYSANFSNKCRDPQFSRMCFGSLQGCLPIRISVFHGCHPPPLYRFVARILFLLLGERLRKRIIPHCGTNEQVNNTLRNKFDIPLEYIPSDMGGNLSLKMMTWIQDRREAGL